MLSDRRAMDKQRKYPDITDILAQKEKWRRERASLSFAEKLDIIDKMRRDIEPFVRNRNARLLKSNKTTSDDVPPSD
jgi:hypothetical protein